MAHLTAPKVHMGTLTGGEGRALYAGNPVILLPMGSHEDQGPHAPMGDYLLAEAIAERAALRATAAGTPTVVAPVLPFGGADYFGAMVGGIALSEATLTCVIRDMIASLHRHRLTRLIIINGHGGNVGPIATVTREVFQATGMQIPSLYLWRIGYALLPGIVGAETAKAVSGHGADPLTSIGLHLFPDMLRPDMIPQPRGLARNTLLDLPYTALGAVSFEGAEVSVPTEYDEVYAQGVGKGDPNLCSAETGAALTEQLTGIVARFAQHYAAKVG
jgi:creatinine amidohydrolase